jgi:hypothetical protein
MSDEILDQADSAAGPLCHCWPATRSDTLVMVHSDRSEIAWRRRRSNSPIVLATRGSDLSGTAVRLTNAGRSRGGTLVRWRPGFPSYFPPTSLLLPSYFPPSDAGPRGTGRYGRGPEGRRMLSTGRLCTSQAMNGCMWGCDGTCGETAVPVKSPALPTQVRILSLPPHLTCGNTVV